MGCVPEKTKDRQEATEEGKNKKSRSKGSRKSIDKKEQSHASTPVRDDKDEDPTDVHRQSHPVKQKQDQLNNSHHRRHSKKKQVEESPSKEPIFVPQKSKHSRKESSKISSKPGSVAKGNCKFMETWGQLCTHPECEDPSPFSPLSPEGLDTTVNREKIVAVNKE